ncbi:hypothetical protein K458DRAFT_421563 [Lentithecium fluviatile CBS 122367]|uniref:Uncharacterized protein n=1 Tax=Lentithecium fluviatile CBS 122367 TaxID=1168545 RepID=A0A6G1IR34_9PLEO|nr:hypothetical protein K458DRAFT_421563 [Lentithecium fluviatile CBS 122367]
MNSSSTRQRTAYKTAQAHRSRSTTLSTILYTNSTNIQHHHHHNPRPQNRNSKQHEAPPQPIHSSLF